MPASYHSLSTEDLTSHSKSEKHVSFDPELQYRLPQDNKSKRKQRVTGRIHLFGLLTILLGLVFYSYAWRVSTSIGLEQLSTDDHEHHHHQAPHSAMTESTPNHKTAVFCFDKLDQFSLHEILDNQGYHLLDIHGTITLTSSQSPRDAAIVTNISMTTHNIEIESTDFQNSPNGLTIGNPGLKNRSYLRRPSITIDILVNVKPGTALTTFTADTRHLNIEIDPSLDLSVSESTTLCAVSGSVNSRVAPASFTSRDKYISSVSGGIRGSYALEDVLSCSTASGGIRIGVLPKKAGEVVAPAAFSARSNSGHCDVQFETMDAPDREYTVDVHSGSGGVSGTYIHGRRTRVESGSGSKRVAVYPLAGEGASELITEGVSGSSNVEVRSPLKNSKTLGALKSTHRSVSGSLSLSYPREWAGNFEGTSVSGSLGAEGPGLEVERGGGPGLKRVSGRSKVEGQAELSFSSVSGGARLVVA